MYLRQAHLTSHDPVMRNQDVQISFSQFGEDVCLWSILSSFGRLDTGCYVDVGAFHPFQYSNTALLHLYRGWSGVNIDASPEAIAAFQTHRPADHNVHAAVSDETSQLEYVMFDQGAVNSLHTGMQGVQTREGSPFTVKRREVMMTRRLDEILDAIGTIDSVDVLSVDCEGLDLNVLRSNNWEKYRPYAVLVETHGMNPDQPDANPTHRYLKELGYRLISHIFVTSIYVRSG